VTLKVPEAENPVVDVTLIVTVEYWITPVAKGCEAATVELAPRVQPVNVVAVTPV
jgi:hypothetical protein